MKPPLAAYIRAKKHLSSGYAHPTFSSPSFFSFFSFVFSYLKIIPSSQAQESSEWGVHILSQLQQFFFWSHVIHIILYDYLAFSGLILKFFDPGNRYLIFEFIANSAFRYQSGLRIYVAAIFLAIASS